MKGKLVRDKIPEIIKAHDKRIPRTRRLSLAEFKHELRKKLIEEATEAAKAGSKTLAEELADIAEIVDAISKVYNIKRSAITRLQKSKRAKRGAFNKRIFLVE